MIHGGFKMYSAIAGIFSISLMVPDGYDDFYFHNLDFAASDQKARSNHGN